MRIEHMEVAFEATRDYGCDVTVSVQAIGKAPLNVTQRFWVEPNDFKGMFRRMMEFATDNIEREVKRAIQEGTHGPGTGTGD